MYLFLKAVSRSDITPTMDEHVGAKPAATNIGKNTLLLLLLFLFIINIFHVKKRLSLNNDRHQYQQNEQPSLTSNL